MKANKRILGAGVALSLLVMALGARAVLAQKPVPPTPPAAVHQEDGPGDRLQVPSYTGSIALDEAQFEGMNEADEAAALQGMATISADQAKAAAEASNPGATAVRVELDNENSVLVYSVEMSNGLEVKVDAGNGTILHTEPADAHESRGSDTDNVQEGFAEEYEDIVAP